MYKKEKRSSIARLQPRPSCLWVLAFPTVHPPSNTSAVEKSKEFWVCSILAFFADWKSQYQTPWPTDKQKMMRSNSVRRNTLGKKVDEKAVVILPSTLGLLVTAHACCWVHCQCALGGCTRTHSACVWRGCCPILAGCQGTWLAVDSDLTRGRPSRQRSG